ncbi:prophage antirepressor-like protein [Pseudomonas lini]|nr:prophage antirepressor-like protein [Pseudomonas lini]
MDENYLVPHVFTRHNLHLHALLLQNQPWFSARDLGRLLRLFLDERTLRNSTPTNAKPQKHSPTAASKTPC